MAGRGSFGRGRGIPLTYPDGNTSVGGLERALAMRDGTHISQTRPIFELPEIRLTAGDKEIINLQRRLQTMPARKAFFVEDKDKSRDFTRYSDRYLDPPVEPFHSSSAKVIQAGFHHPRELLPSKKSDKRKRSGGGDGAGGSSSKSGRDLAKTLKQLEDGDGTGGCSEEEEEDEMPSRRKRTIKDDEEDEDDKSRNNGNDSDVESDEVPSEEEDVLYDDQQDGAYGDGFEDGFDDADSGGEDEPTY